MIPIRTGTAPNKDVRAAITLIAGLRDYRDGTVDEEAEIRAEKIVADMKELLE